MNTVLRYVRRAALLSDHTGLTDAHLLAAFVGRREEAAFEALVRRYAPVVWGVCRKVRVASGEPGAPPPVRGP
jgi:hypothetical protein